MFVVQVVSVVYIVKGNARRRQDVKICWMGLSQHRSCVVGVYKDRGTTHNTVAQAVEDLISWWVLEIAI